MKKVFSEYYDPPELTYKEIWDKALFVFDTNLLLNLYRYTTVTRDIILDVMNKVSDRIWIPYQVGLEYFNNRIKVINEVSNGYDAIKKFISNYKNGFEKYLNDNYNHHPYINRDMLKKRYSNDIIKPINDLLDEWKRNDPKYQDNDVIWKKLTDLFDGKVGEDFSSENLYKLYKEGEIRYAHQVPPGYMDLPQKKDQGERALYGDLIVWKQTIEKAKETYRDVIFVTDDKKNDWFEAKVKGKRSGPRKELLREFSKESDGQKILIYNQESFLKYANDYLKADIKEESIKEVKDVSIAVGTNHKVNKKYPKGLLREYGILTDNYAQLISPTDISALTMHLNQSNNTNPLSSIAGWQSFLDQHKSIAEWQSILERQKSLAEWSKTLNDATQKWSLLMSGKQIKDSKDKKDE